MHIRVRNKIAQLIRTSYDKGSKKARNTILGKVNLANPVLDDTTRASLTASEAAEFDNWVLQQQRATLLREELAALSLADTLSAAGRWFAREGDTPASRAAAAAITANWQLLRQAIRKSGAGD